MAYIRTKTIKGRQYQYLQHSVRKGKKVKTISKYLGAVLMSPLIVAGLVSANAKQAKRGGYPGHKSTDERAKAHQDQANRERYEKEMEKPKERFHREAAKAAAMRADKAEAAPDPKVADAIREFNEARAAEK